MKNLLEVYDEKLSLGVLHPDKEQEQAVNLFSTLSLALSSKEKKGFLEKVLSKDSFSIKGLYIYGGVGRGKSMLMDMFFDHLTIDEKRRVHFHEFMLEVHDFLHVKRTQRDKAKKDPIDSDLIAFAREVAATTKLLCFDEFHVDDVADAMILGRLFTALFDMGVVVVMTSNIKPDDLYKDGLQRELFLPFIEVLKDRLNVIHFSGEMDYRITKLQKKNRYFTPITNKTNEELLKVFSVISGGKSASSQNIKIKGRNLYIPRASGEVVEFSFSELCEKAKSALDYLELVKRFRVFIVKDIPVMGDDDRNILKRFITFIDTLYDHHGYLVVSAAGLPEDLYKGELEAETFKRTVSRLKEMQSTDYGGN